MTNSNHDPWRVVVIFAVLLALIVRIPGLNTGLWFDEIWTLVDLVRAPLSKCVTTYESDNNHPLYSLAAWFSVRGLGESAWALRLPALIFGLLSIVALYAFARRHTSRGVAEVSCIAFALSWHHVTLSQDARAYTMLLFFTLVSSTCFLETLESPSWKNKAGLAVTLALATYAHMTGVFVALAQLGLWVFLRKAPGCRWGALQGIVLAGVISLLLHAPLLGDMFEFFSARAEEPSVASEWQNPIWTVQEIARSFGLSLNAALALGLVASSIAALGLSRIAGRSTAAAWMCILPAFIGGVILVLLERNLWPRFFFFGAGFFVLVGVEGLAGVIELLGKWLGRTVLLKRIGTGILILAMSWHLQGSVGLPKQDFVGAGDFALEKVGQEHARILTVGLASFPYESYYGGGFEAVTEVTDLESAAGGERPVYVISTFPIYLRSREPDVAAWISDHSREVARFRGTKGDGDVVVYRVN